MRIPHDHLVERHTHLVRGVAAEMLIGQKENALAALPRPSQRRRAVGRRADDTAALADEGFDGRGRVDIGDRDDLADAHLRKLFPAGLELIDRGHVGHRAAGGKVGQYHLLMRRREHVGAFRHEMHAAEHDELGLGMLRDLAGEAERVADVVGELDHLIALVVMAEDDQPIAERRPRSRDAAIELFVGQSQDTARGAAGAPRCATSRTPSGQEAASTFELLIIAVLRRQCALARRSERRRRHDVVERVALHGRAAGRADDALDIARRQRFGRARARHVVNLLLLHRSVEIVDTEPQRRLRQLDAGGNPERLHVRDVVEHEPRHRVDAQGVRSGRRRQLPHLVVVGMKRQRDERLKTARFILQRAGAQHVIHALFVRLDMAVQHRDVRLHPEAVRRAVDRQPPVGVRFVVADFLPHALGEHFGASAGQRRQARIHQLPQHLLVGHAVEIGEECDLDRGETLQMNLGADPLEATQHLKVVLERQVRMQAIDDVDFGERLVVPHTQLLPRVFERHRVRAGIAGPQPRERAEQTARDAYVRRLDADVVVVVGQIAMPALALTVGERRDVEQAGMLEQAHTVLERQPLAPRQLAGNVSDHQPSILSQCYTSKPQPTFSR